MNLSKIPGHVQNVRLYFNAGSDIVQGGLVELFCSKGLKVLEPGIVVNDDCEWKSNCSFDLKPCQPGEKLTMIVTVKCDANENYSADGQLQDQMIENDILSQTLQAIVTTSYHHKLYTQVLESKKMRECTPMSAILQAKVTTLERPALTISDSNAFLYTENLAVVNATVNCNTPVPFSLKEWNITFPSPLYLEEKGDLNDGLFNRSVIEGEELFFGFKCRVDLSGKLKAKDERPLLKIILQDQFNKSFLQVLPLNIDAFYQKMANECKMGKSNIATAKFSLASQEGLIGSPVVFSCDIDCGSLKQTEKSHFLFNLSCDNSDWIIGGKVRGALDISNEEKRCSLEFVGIPTRSGDIKSFPTIELMNQASSSFIKVVSKYPTSFMSLSHKSIETFAYLSLHEV